MLPSRLRVYRPKAGVESNRPTVSSIGGPWRPGRRSLLGVGNLRSDVDPGGDCPYPAYFKGSCCSAPMSTATKIVLGTVVLSVLAALALIVNTILAG